MLWIQASLASRDNSPTLWMRGWLPRTLSNTVDPLRPTPAMYTTRNGSPWVLVKLLFGCICKSWFMSCSNCSNLFQVDPPVVALPAETLLEGAVSSLDLMGAVGCVAYSSFLGVSSLDPAKMEA